jgi:hypothetical protein
MFANFNDLPNRSRVWIYQADRVFSVEESALVEQLLRQFVSKWEAHQHPLQASYQLRYQRFIILAVNADFYQPSGCSIDTSVALIRQIEQNFGIKLFDRLTLAYWDNDEVKTLKNKDLKARIAQGEFSMDTLIFDNTIQDKAGLETQWQIPASKSWVAKYEAVLQEVK